MGALNNIYSIESIGLMVQPLARPGRLWPKAVLAKASAIHGGGESLGWGGEVHPARCRLPMPAECLWTPAPGEDPLPSEDPLTAVQADSPATAPTPPVSVRGSGLNRKVQGQGLAPAGPRPIRPASPRPSRSDPTAEQAFPSRRCGYEGVGRLMDVRPRRRRLSREPAGYRLPVSWLTDGKGGMLRTAMTALL